MAKPATAPAFVCERFDSVRPTRIDRDKGVVEGVRVLNAVSRNGRVYPESVLHAHLGLYRNLPVNVGHHFDFATMTPLPVPPGDRFGVLGSNPRVDAGGVTSDLQFNPEHAFAKPFLWACENSPALYSFSPLHRVKWCLKRDAQSRLVAESILEAASADIVSDGGTTSTIFESRTWAREAMADGSSKPVAADVAAQLETDGDWMAFLTDLFNEAKGLSQTTKDMVISLVTSAMSASAAEPPAPGSDMAAAAPAMEALKRFGKVGKWAAEQLDRLLTAEAAKKRQEWAAELVKAELVPESLVTPVFLGLVAESYGNESRAKEVIADRKALSAGGAGKGTPVTSDRAGAKTVKQLVEEFTFG